MLKWRHIGYQHEPFVSQHDADLLRTAVYRIDREAAMGYISCQSLKQILKGENTMFVTLTDEQYCIIVDTLLEHGEDILARAFVKTGLGKTDQDAEDIVDSRKRYIHKEPKFIDKIDLIKIFREFTGLGLVQAKFAVEVFYQAHGIAKFANMTSIKDFSAFMWYIQRFVKNTYYINGDVYDNMSLLYSPQPKPVSFDDIKAIKG